MKIHAMIMLLVSCGAGHLFAQMPPPPKSLPANLNSPTNPFSPKGRDSTEDKLRKLQIANLKEDIRPVENVTLRVKQMGGVWSVFDAQNQLKSFGNNRDASETFLLTLRDLNANQFGHVEGARPAFEYWIRQGQACRSQGRNVVIPIVNRHVRAEKFQQVWVLTDGLKVLYEFGQNEDACRKAATIFSKYEFNQLIVIGSPNPVALLPVRDPWQRDPGTPMPQLQPLAYTEVDRTSYSLPDGTFVGARVPFDGRALSIQELRGHYYLIHGDDMIARFGGQEKLAQVAMQSLKDARISEMVRVGNSGLSLWLTHGEPLRHAPASASQIQTFRLETLKVQSIRDTFWLFDDTRPLLAVGSKADAENLLKILQRHRLQALATYGQPETGLRIFCQSR